MWVHLLDKDGFVQFKLNHFYINWSFGVQCLIWCHNQTYVILSIKLLNLKQIIKNINKIKKYFYENGHNVLTRLHVFSSSYSICETLLSLRHSFSLAPPWTSFLSLTHFFYLYESNLCCHFSRFCFVLLFSWHFCGNNEAEGTCFLQVPTAVYSHCQLTTRVWGLLALPGGEGVNCGGAADSCWTLPPSVTPLLPAPWWVVASGAHCLRSADKRWKFDGTFQTSSLLKWKKMKPMTYSFCDQWYPVRGLQISSQKSQRVCQKRGLLCLTHFSKWLLTGKCVQFTSGSIKSSTSSIPSMNFTVSRCFRVFSSSGHIQ